MYDLCNEQLAKEIEVAVLKTRDILKHDTVLEVDSLYDQIFCVCRKCEKKGAIYIDSDESLRVVKFGAIFEKKCI